MHRNYLNSAHKKKLKSMGLLIVVSLLLTCNDALEEVPKAFLTPQNFY